MPVSEGLVKPVLQTLRVKKLNVLMGIGPCERGSAEGGARDFISPYGGEGGVYEKSLEWKVL